MNAKEQQRGTVLNRMERGGLTGQQAARLMGLSLRQVRRLLAAYRKDGVAALAHGNRGRSPLHRIQEETRDMVVELARGPYRGFNHYQLQEELAEREGLHLSRSSLWRILTGAKVPSSRRRRKAQYRQRRERYPQEGMLLQVDGNRHDWLEGRGPYLSLLAVIDDATSALPAALFREQEDAHGYLLLLEEVIRNKGIPLAIYSDRHGIFQVNPKQRETVEEQLAGERQPTQFGRALEEPGNRVHSGPYTPSQGPGGKTLWHTARPAGQPSEAGRCGQLGGGQPGAGRIPAPAQPVLWSVGSPAWNGLPGDWSRHQLGGSPVLQVPAHGGQRQYGEAGRAHPSDTAWAGTGKLRQGPGCRCKSGWMAA